MSTPLTEQLPNLVNALESAIDAEGWGSPPAIVRITNADDDGFDLGVRPVEGGSSVVDVLSGFVAPADWLALGVVTEGNARRLDADDPERQRVRCVHIVDRDGASASSLRLHGEQPTTLDGKSTGAGRIDDVCRRALGLTTAAPERTSIELWAAMWLTRLLVIDITEPVTWRAAAELHPAISPLTDEPTAHDEIVRLGVVLSEVHSWSTVRLACAAGEWPCAEVPDDVAGWLDDGAFSRWVMGGFPLIPTMAVDAKEWLPSHVANRVLETLRLWELLPPV